MNPIDNRKSDYLMALGRFIVCFSKVQNILQEGIYVLSAKIHSTEDDLIRCFMHKMLINQLEDIFLTLATEYGSKCNHIDIKQLEQIRKQISKQLDTLKSLRNKMMHSVWSEKFWEGKYGEHKYRMIYHKNKEFKFQLDEEDFNYEKLNQYSRNSLFLESFIHDFLICISDGDTQPDKNFNNYFCFAHSKAIFPRQRDIEKYKNIDDYI